tara:strand:- start:83 stop:862 length:780 start_codon:yes stop_codon:yes gene_type:complete
MVTDNTEQPVIPVEAPAAPEADGGDTASQEGAITDAPQAEVAPETSAEVAPAPDVTQASAPDATQLPGSEAVPPQQAPATPQYTPEQLAKMQQDAIQYEEVRQRAALQNQATQYRTQLEQQGYLPEQAEALASQYMQSQEQQTKLIKQAEQYGQHLQGKQLAAEHFVKQYNLTVADLEQLRRYDDPQSMDNAAKTISHNRQRDAELSTLKQSQVPSQQVDNSQGTPDVGSDEGSWLDRYNSGDRTVNAVSAARRAAGLQ